MKFYFQILYKRQYRKIAEMGIHPALGVGIIAIASILIAIFLMQKTVYAHYIIGFLGLSVVASLNEKKRNDFLNLCFSKTKFLKIRLIENLLLISPFVIFLIFTEEYLIAGITLLLSEFFVFTHFNKKWSFHIPSPFSKYPFEFSIGFRKLFLIYPAVYFLVFKAIEVGNFNLGVFAIGLLIFTHISYYFKPEQKYFVWIFSRSPQGFLWHKTKEGLFFSSLTLLPILILLSIWFPEQYINLLGLLFLNALLISTMILAKYSAFPKEMSVPQMVLFGLSIWFPPILIIAIIYFYKQSLKNLNLLLK